MNSSPGQKFNRLLGALDELVAQETATLASRDFEAISEIQQRAAPLVEGLTALGVDAADDIARARVAALLARRQHNIDFIETQLATDVGADNSDGFDPGLLYVYAIASASVPAAKLEQALLAEVDRLVKDGVTEQELQKVKNQKLAGIYRALETINGKAQNLGNYEVFFGDYRKLFDAPDAYRKVTTADIQRVAATYMKKSQRTVGVLAAKED